MWKSARSSFSLFGSQLAEATVALSRCGRLISFTERWTVFVYINGPSSVWLRKHLWKTRRRETAAAHLHSTEVLWLWSTFFKHFSFKLFNEAQVASLAVNNDQQRGRGSLGRDVDIYWLQVKPCNIGSSPQELNRCQTTADGFQDGCRSYAKVSLHIYGISLNPKQ